MALLVVFRKTWALYFNGRQNTRSAPVAQLSVVVVARRPEAAVGFEDQGVIVPCGNSYDTACQNLLRHGEAYGGAIPKLTIAVAPRPPETAVAPDDEGVAVARDGSNFETSTRTV